MIKILSENLRLILVGFIAILMIAAGAVVISLYFGGDVAREIIITEITGSAYIQRDGKRLNADKRAKLKSGDILTTDKKCTVRLSMDGDKYISVEPDTTVYVYYTDVASKGSISVNLTKGAVICQLNKKLDKKSDFSLKTPNSTVSVKGTVFRAEFNCMDSYMGYEDVMITEVQNLEGTVMLQLYDAGKEPFDLPMVLVEGTRAQMITAADVCRYGYLNYDIDLSEFSEITLREITRASTEKQLAFGQDVLGEAYRAAAEESRRLETMTETTTETTEETKVTTVRTTASTTETTTTSDTSETTSETTYGTLATTHKKHEYTTYSGIKWWEITGNTDTGTDDYEDWFSEPSYGNETTTGTVTAGTTAAVPN